MQGLSHFVLSAGLASVGNAWVLIGIAVAACVLGIQVACIGILIRKMLAASGKNHSIESEEESHEHRDYAAVLAIGAATSFVAETVLILLSVLVAIASVVFLVLLIVCRVKGYDFAALDGYREEAAPTETVEMPVAPIAESEEETALPVAEEGLTEAVEDEPVEVADDATEEEITIEEPETIEVAETTAEEPVAVTTSVQQTATETVTPIASIGGATPVKVVQIEKEYTETIREVQNPASDASGEILEKLNTIIDKMEQKGTAAEEVPTADKPATQAAPAYAAEDAEEEDEDEDDDTDADDTTASESGDEDDGADDEMDDAEHFTGNERIIGFDEATGCYIVAHYRKSFEAKLIQARPNIKQYYSELKNALLAYKGTKSRVSWNADSFHNGRSPIAKINVKTRILEIYLAIDPASLEGTVYRGRDVGHLKKYADTPFQYKVRTPRKFKWAMELVQRVCEEHGLSPIDIEKVDYEAAYPFDDTDSLVARGLVKEYIREEKPASTFELDDTHVPHVADVDETVIPANANISWEFDNEMLAQKEPEPTPEPAPEVEPEPQKEEAPAATAPTGSYIRETTRTTQVRYTEQYFGESGGEKTSYAEYLSGDDPFTAEFVESTPAEEPKTQPMSETETESVTEEAPVEEATEEIEEEITEESVEEISEETAEEAAEEEKEPTTGLLSAFEEDRAEDTEEDLDWGIPASLQYTVAPEETEVETVEEDIPEEEPTEDTVEEAAPAETDEDDQEYTEEYTDETEGEYAEEGYYDEDGQEYAEEYADETEGEYAEEGYYDEDDQECVEETEEQPQPRQNNVNPEVALVDVKTLEENFEDGDTVDLEILKEKGLVMETAKTLKLFASGPISKALNVVAHQYTTDALFAIAGAGGTTNAYRN